MYPLFERKGACTPQEVVGFHQKNQSIEYIIIFGLAQNSRARHYFFEPLNVTAVGFVNIYINIPITIMNHYGN